MLVVFFGPSVFVYYHWGAYLQSVLSVLGCILDHIKVLMHLSDSVYAQPIVNYDSIPG